MLDVPAVAVGAEDQVALGVGVGHMIARHGRHGLEERAAGRRVLKYQEDLELVSDETLVSLLAEARAAR
jgi:hypothetical protein